MISRREFVAGSAAVTLVSAAGARPASRRFPAGFLWGAATSAYQTEGNNVQSDVWVLEHVKPTTYAEPSGDATNSFELWPRDLELVRAMGLNCYRFSLEWSRIEPEPGQISLAMLDHYKRMIEACRDQGIAPIVSFNHLSTPVWFAARGGWLDGDAPQRFGAFCDRAARHLAGGIGKATTLNEPNFTGMVPTLMPPAMAAQITGLERAMAQAAARKLGAARFVAGNALSIDDPDLAQRNLLAAHGLGKAAIKAVRADLPVGVTLAMVDDQASGATDMRDMVRERLYGPWLRAAREDDFVGVQNYSRAVWSSEGRLPPPPDAVLSDSGLEVYAGSLAGVVRHAHAVAGVPVLVTEHGVGTSDDGIRAKLIPDALVALKQVIDDGVPVLGYIHWSLVDNYEWAFGYRHEYGLHSVDRTTFVRTPKPSAAVLARIARANAL